MNDVTHWKISKIPFLIGDALLLATAYFFIQHSPHPIGRLEVMVVSACVALGAALGCLPFILDYRAVVKTIEASALGNISEKIQNLEKLAAQISSATNEWTNAQSQAEKTSAGAKEISEKMAVEVREFTAFMQKMNDSEKSTLRLEVEKLHRGETEWLQVLVRIFDHIFALHTAAVRTGEAKFAEPITNFQNACRETARRIGLTPFIAAPDEKFNAELHQIAGSKEKPAAGAAIAETVGVGYTFQGKLLRPALVRVRDADSTSEKPAATAEPAGAELPL
jgi:molecular chaperone GrpE (heat shock protein)